MPEIDVKRQGITPAARDVPTSTALVIQPMTLEKVGQARAENPEESARRNLEQIIRKSSR